MECIRETKSAIYSLCLGKRNMILSIIIPVYNVEPYLDTCLNSVLECDLTDCEIILSLRESKDRSCEICMEYQSRYPFIRIVKQDGVGLSNARNCAMRLAQGEYVLFIDSDDNVDSQILSDLIEKLRSKTIVADVVATDFFHVVHPSQKLIPYFQIGEKTPDQSGLPFLPKMLRRRQCFWNVWRYIYRRKFLEDNKISFMENMLSEDVDYTTSVFLAEPDIFFSHSPFYYYHVCRGESLMDKPTLRRLRETVYVLSTSIERLKHSSFPYADNMISQFQFEYFLNIALAVEIDSADQASALALFENNPTVLRGSNDPVVVIAAFFVRLFGVKFSSNLLHIAKLIRRRHRGTKM